MTKISFAARVVRHVLDVENVASGLVGLFLVLALMGGFEKASRFFGFAPAKLIVATPAPEPAVVDAKGVKATGKVRLPADPAVVRCQSAKDPVACLAARR